MPIVTIGLTIAPQSPISVGAAGSTGDGAGRSCVRDGYGRLVLPGSSLKGKLRHACEAVLRGLDVCVCQAPRAERMCGPDDEPCAICRLFGSPAHRGPLTFADLVYHDPIGGDGYAPDAHRLDDNPTIRPGIGMDRRRRTVAHNLLFFVETSPVVPATPDRPSGTFANEAAITGAVPDRVHLRLLLAGLAYVSAWGGGKSRGLGWGRVQTRVTYDGKEVDLAAGARRLGDMEELRGL